jgi:hypothetical protein
MSSTGPSPSAGGNSNLLRMPVAASDAKTTDFGGICREVARADSLEATFHLQMHFSKYTAAPKRENGALACIISR